MNSKEVILIVAIVAALAIFLMVRNAQTGMYTYEDPCMEAGVHGVAFYDFYSMEQLKLAGFDCFVTSDYIEAGCCVFRGELNGKEG